MANPLIDYLLNNAPSNICVDGTVELKQAKTTDDFLAIYLKYIDFCLSEKFPTDADLLKYGHDHLIANGIYIDTPANLLNKSTAVLAGRSKSTAQYNGYSVGQIYMKDSTSLTLSVQQNSFLIIDCFDNSNLIVEATGNSKVLVNIYGHARIHPAYRDQATIKIVNKFKATY